MSHHRKTRTKSTDSLPARHIRKLNQIRREVAAEAARIIATEGQGNYHLAKKKAAERVGISQRLALPSNLEVQEALQDYQRLYGGEEHSKHLELLRTEAMDIMAFLSEFSPRLVGPVLDGTASKHSRISFHVFCEEPEILLLFFLENGMPFTQEQRQIRWHDGSYKTIQLLLIEKNGVTAELAVFSQKDIRQAPPSPIDGRPQRRASLLDLECMLNEQDVIKNLDVANV